MPITADDIVLLESERLTDANNAGGRMTTHVVPDNVAGNVFPKVSRLDATYGRVNLRKLYLGVQTALTELYSGAHVIVSEPPIDPLVQPLLFSTGSSFDTRSDARNRIESYVVAGPESAYVLYGTQVAGQMSIKVYARESVPLPDIGDVLCLSIESGTTAGNQQYVRLTDVEHGVAEFEDSRGVFSRRVITLGISAPLVRDYPAGPVVRESAHGNATLVRETVIADAARYFGTQRLAQPATAGALTVYVNSVYGQVVPSTRRETPVVNASISDATIIVDAVGEVLTQAWPNVFRRLGANVHHFGRAIVPRPGEQILFARATFALAYRVYDNGDGTGAVALVQGTNPDLLTNVVIDYASGILSYVALSGSEADWEVFETSVTVGARVSHPSHTRQIEITPATRGTVYAETLMPIPAPGTLILDYRALGRWYRLRDDGTGILTGADPSIGNGSIDNTTGALVVTLGALPDIGSAVLLAWGSPVHYEIRAGAVAVDPPEIDYTVEHPAILPGSVALTWLAGGIERTATDNGAGVLTGAGAGAVSYAQGRVRLRPTLLPDPSSLAEVSYTTVSVTQGTSEVAPSGSGSRTLSFTVAGDDAMRPRSFGASFAVRRKMSFSSASYTTDVIVDVRDDGAGGIVADGTVAETHGITIGGTIDYATRAVSISIGELWQQPIWNEGSGSWYLFGRPTELHAPTTVSHTWSADSADETEHTETTTIGGLSVDITPLIADPVVPGSVMATIGGKTYIDVGGTLYADVSATTGSGTPAGTFDYAAGRAALTLWTGGVAPAVTVQSLLTQYGDWTATDVQFRTPGSPIRPASLYVQANRPDGALITGTADVNGEITGTYMRGEVQQDMGVVVVEFGEDIESVWTPIEVLPGTIRYNCVVLADLPLSADVLGLDPVRLPSDGRVPIYRPADVLVIHHTESEALPDPAVAGATYELSRGALDYVEIVDQAGDRVPRDRYTVDLDEGEVTLADPLDLDDYTQPLIVRHRIEDMALAADVQITGEITLSAALTHDYPADETLVSSALIAGDLYAHVSHLFDQSTWTSVWQDTPAGSVAAANYDDINYPVAVSNEGCVTERWRVHFTSTTAFSLYGENLGLIATGNTSTDLSPVNPLTGLPYFTLLAAGWGSGWAAGNQLRINTRGANFPVWISRSILAGASRSGDRFDLAIRGDTDDE